jgi:hypothetical protein
VTSAITQTIDEQLSRLENLWPTLKKKPEILDEIRQAIIRQERRITTLDISRGFDALIEKSPTSGWPPGPHEVMGCILFESGQRLISRTADRGMPDGLPEVAGRYCSHCEKPVKLLAHDRFIYCDGCNLVQVFTRTANEVRYRLEWHEVDQVPVVRRSEDTITW